MARRGSSRNVAELRTKRSVHRSQRSTSKRAFEVTDMMWVLRKKKDEKGGLLKYKARAVVCGNQQKRKALASGAEYTLETFAPAARSATFKLLCAVGCVANLR
eukprot:1870855-Pleurochrysis_carterae.AAC.1